MELSGLNPEFQLQRGINYSSSLNWIESIKNGDRQALAKAITLCESSLEEDVLKAQELLSLCSQSKKSLRIGITGIPGVGKSSFIDALGSLLVERYGKKVAVLAVDPSSTRTRGSVLGDKTRMEKLSSLNNAYIRPLPSKTELGGVVSGLVNAIRFAEEAGFDVVFVETVGVGQSETEISKAVDVLVFLLLPNSGDEIQGIKRGIMEEVHLVVVNKAEKENMLAAKKTKHLLESVLHIMQSPIEQHERKVILCSSTEKTGIEQVWKEINNLFVALSANGWVEQNRKRQKVYQFQQLVSKMQSDLFYGKSEIKKELDDLKQKVEEGEIEVFTAAKKLFSKKDF